MDVPFEENQQELCKQLDDDNRKVLAMLRTGDLVIFQHQTYSHWAVFIDDDCVAHLTKDKDDEIDKFRNRHDSADERFSKASVHRTSFLELAGNSKAVRNSTNDKERRPLPRGQIMRRLARSLSDKGTSKFEDSRDFAMWCRYGDS